MQHIGRLYVLYVNKEYRRSGALFEGRHKASLVAADDLTFYRLFVSHFCCLVPL
jgi:hypothetical protein